MFCPHCGCALERTYRFCPVCGKPVPLPDTQRPVPPDELNEVYEGVPEEPVQGELQGDTDQTTVYPNTDPAFQDNRQTIFVTQNITVIQQPEGRTNGQDAPNGNRAEEATVPLRQEGGFLSVLPLLLSISGLVCAGISAFFGLPFFWLALIGLGLCVAGLVLVSVRMRRGFREPVLKSARIVSRIGVILSSVYLVLLLLLFIFTAVFS
ncbi:MAG: zinc ribbon domain-containing protein [Clostridia bacterium]|nr:zinc ribbon domain-containing protein [Clostridia bacterium]